MVVAYFLCHPV